MEIERITPELVEDYLSAYQKGEKIPVELLGLHFLQNHNFPSPKEKEYWLFDQIHAWAQDALARCRHYEEVQISPSAIPLDCIKADFTPGNQLLESWSAVYYRYLSPVPLRVEKIMQVISYSDKNFRRRVESGLREIVKLLSQVEIESHQRQSLKMRGRFVPSLDSKLFGLEALILKRVERIKNCAESERFFCIEGLGGIGKTTLAQAIASRLAEWPELKGILWASAKYEFLTLDGTPKIDPEKSALDLISTLASQLGLDYLAGLSLEKKLEGLAAALASHQYLIVLDNLETLEDMVILMRHILTLAGPSKYLLTSRYSLSIYPQVISFPLEPLSYADARAFFINEIERNGRKMALTSIPEEFIHTVYDLAGGIPLALKLIAAQIGKAQPPEKVLRNLRAGRDTQRKDKEAELFSYIYQDSWELLSEPAQDLLRSMLFVPLEGETAEWIQMNADVDESIFPEAFNELLNLSLVEISGSILLPHYFIHRLTATFLKTDLHARWTKEK